VEWAGAVFESPEDMVADEIGLTHPRWREPRWATGRCMPMARSRSSVTDTGTATRVPRALAATVTPAASRT
jgi:hypothetical protein